MSSILIYEKEVSIDLLIGLFGNFTFHVDFRLHDKSI